MTTLTVTARGQVTFRKKVLQHLGIKPGEKVALELLPDGRGFLHVPNGVSVKCSLDIVHSSAVDKHSAISPGDVLCVPESLHKFIQLRFL